jgi:hypothetical protein
VPQKPMNDCSFLSIVPLVAKLGSASVRDGKRAMKDKTPPATLLSQAAEVRRIAEGIFDKGERRVVLRFVAESVKLSKKSDTENL